MSNFKEKMNSCIPYIEEQLEKYMPKQGELPPVVFEAMRYSLFAGGKRLRPMMILAACEAVGGNKDYAAPFACAMEMIHTYSLIHDDLPAMDNDDYRRGRLTNHKVYGDDMAILAGDGLLHHAMEVMADACYADPCKKTTGAMRAIAYGAGLDGMLSGQAADVYFEGKEINASTLYYIHKNKTAGLITASLKAGALLGGADEATADKFFMAGEKIGVAFQILDDILDVIGNEEVLGKPVHSDERNKKITYPTLYGIERSKEIARELSEGAIAIWRGIEGDMEVLIEMTMYLTERKF